MGFNLTASDGAPCHGPMSPVKYVLMVRPGRCGEPRPLVVGAAVNRRFQTDGGARLSISLTWRLAAGQDIQLSAGRAPLRAFSTGDFTVNDY
jgi:hypothetical protein